MDTRQRELRRTTTGVGLGGTNQWSLSFFVDNYYVWWHWTEWHLNSVVVFLPRPGTIAHRKARHVMVSAVRRNALRMERIIGKDNWY